MVVGILLAGPSSLRIQRSVAAKDPSAAKQFLGTASVQQPATVEVAGAALPPKSNFTATKSSLSLYASDQSWVVACVDEKLLFARLFTTGDSRTFEFDRRAIVRVGRAGSVRVVSDGNGPKTMGGLGEVRVMEFTPGASHFLKGGEVEDCTDGH
jgi:hypothetical protein